VTLRGLAPHAAELDATWVNVDSDEGESCSGSDWDSPEPSPPGSPRLAGPKAASGVRCCNRIQSCAPCICLHHMAMLHKLSTQCLQKARASMCCGRTGMSEKARSDKVDIVANANGKTLPGSDDKLAPSTPETTPQGVNSALQLALLPKRARDEGLLLDCSGGLETEPSCPCGNTAEC
jgi:hypothetical protein